MSKKTKSSSTTSSTATVTPNNPTWVTEGLGAVGGGLQKLMGMDPKSFVAGPSALQTKSYQDAGNLSLSPLYDKASGIFNDVAGAGANTYDARGYDAQGYDATDATAQGYTASSLLEGLDRYMSPYTGQVVDAALADFDYGAGQTRANQALDEARSGAFGGSGAAIGRSLTEGEIMRGRGSLSAQLRDQGFTRGADLSARDAGFRNDALQFGADANNRASLANAAARNDAARFGADSRNTAARFGADAQNSAGQFNASALDAALARQLSAGNALTNLGSTMGADNRANIALTNTLGNDQRAIEQALASAPLSVLQEIAKTYGGLPLNLLSGSTTTGSGTMSGTTKTYDPWGTYIALLGANSSNASKAI